MLSEALKTRIEHELDTRSVAIGVWLYRRTRGRVTRLWHRRAIVVTTTGRRTGLPRTVLVQVFHDGADLLVVAANSGLTRPPGWYFNLREHPRAAVELDGQRMQVHAELLSERDAATRWPGVLDVAPDYERYARRIGRIPPMFRLVPEGPEAATPGLRQVASMRNLAAVCGVLAGLGGFVHGVGELRQGSLSPGGVVFDSWTEGRIAANLGGEPAMTVVPDLLLTGALTVGVSLAVMAWAARGLDRRHGASGLAVLSLLMLLVGGGFGPPVLGLLAAFVAAAAHGSRRAPRWSGSRLGRRLAAAWPALFWLCVADAALLVLGSLTAGVLLDRDISDAFVYALFTAIVAVPVATFAGRAAGALDDDMGRRAVIAAAQGGRRRS